ASDSAALAASLAFPDSSLAASASSDATFALRLASVASARDFSAFLFSAAISAPSSVCRRRENKKIPPSQSNSPSTPAITHICQSRKYFFHQSLLAYSPTIPMPSTAPHASSSHSDISRASAVTSLESENIPIPYSDLAGAIGIAIPGIVLLVLLLMGRIPARDRQAKPLSLHSAPPLPKRKPSPILPRADQSHQRPSQASCGESNES